MFPRPCQLTGTRPQFLRIVFNPLLLFPRLHKLMLAVLRFHLLMLTN